MIMEASRGSSLRDALGLPLPLLSTGGSIQCNTTIRWEKRNLQCGPSDEKSLKNSFTKGKVVVLDLWNIETSTFEKCTDDLGLGGCRRRNREAERRSRGHASSRSRAEL